MQAKSFRDLTEHPVLLIVTQFPVPPLPTAAAVQALPPSNAPSLRSHAANPARGA